MARHTKRVGRGITAREVVSYSGEDMRAAFEAFAREWNAALSEADGSSFAAVVSHAERVCRIVLKLAEPPPYVADSAEDYAHRIVCLIDSAKSHIKRGDADAAARMG